MKLDLLSRKAPVLRTSIRRPGGIAIGLTGIGLVSLAAYGIVRAIGWAIDKFV